MSEESLAVIIERLENIKIELAEVKAHVQKTNGSVASLKMWRGYVTGGLAVLTAIVVPLFFLVVAKFLEK